MHCQTCGAEIGDRKVCPFCDTPIRNVLVGGYQPGYGPEGESSVGDTTVIRQENVGPVPVRRKSLTLTESLSTAEVIPVAEKKEWRSVIPDQILGAQKKKRKRSKKRKWIILTAVVLSVLLIATATVFFVLNKKKKTYIEGLRDVSITFKESTDQAPREEKKSRYQNMLSGVDHTAFYMSSSGTYAAYQTESTRTDWVEDHSEAGGYEKTVYIFELYLISENRECLDLGHFEKEKGRIDLVGVTDRGTLIYNDTEEGKSYQLTDGPEPEMLGDLMERGVFYDSGAAVFLTKDGQLFAKAGEDVRQISSSVSDYYYLDGKEYYGYLRPVEQVTSTTSSLPWLVYVSRDSMYRRNLTDSRVGGEPWEGTPAGDPDTVLYNADLMEVKLDAEDLRGEGSVAFEEGELIFRGGGFRRNLGKADRVICLAGDRVYVMRDQKLLQINVFTKEEEMIADHEMIPVIR